MISKIKPKKFNLKKFHDKVWDVWSEYIRRKDNGQCFTCHVKKPWKEMQAGHLFHQRLDFSEYNVHCQCGRCNYNLSGAGAEYTLKLEDMYGKEFVENLKLQANTKGNRYSHEELEQILSETNSKIIKLKEEQDA